VRKTFKYFKTLAQPLRYMENGVDFMAADMPRAGQAARGENVSDHRQEHTGPA